MSKDELVVTVKQSEENVMYFEELKVNTVFVVGGCVFVKMSITGVLMLQHSCKVFYMDRKTEVQLVKTLTATV